MKPPPPEPKCPECHAGIARPKCAFELGGDCARHELAQEWRKALTTWAREEFATLPRPQQDFLLFAATAPSLLRWERLTPAQRQSARVLAQEKVVTLVNDYVILTDLGMAFLRGIRKDVQERVLRDRILIDISTEVLREVDLNVQRGRLETAVGLLLDQHRDWLYRDAAHTFVRWVQSNHERKTS